MNKEVWPKYRELWADGQFQANRSYIRVYEDGRITTVTHKFILSKPKEQSFTVEVQYRPAWVQRTIESTYPASVEAFEKMLEHALNFIKEQLAT